MIIVSGASLCVGYYSGLGTAHIDSVGSNFGNYTLSVCC